MKFKLNPDFVFDDTVKSEFDSHPEDEEPEKENDKDDE